MTSEAQKAATKRYKAAGKQKTMTLHFASAEYELIEDFAKKKLCPVATYCRDAIRQRLDADGAPPLEIKRGRPFAQPPTLAPEAQGTPEPVAVSASALDDRNGPEGNQPRQPQPAETKRRPGRPTGSGKKDAQTIIAAADPGQNAAPLPLDIPADMPPKSSAPSPAPVAVQVSFLPDLPDLATRRNG